MGTVPDAEPYSSGWPRMLPPQDPAQRVAGRLTNFAELYPQEFSEAEHAAMRMVIAALERIAGPREL